MNPIPFREFRDLCLGNYKQPARAVATRKKMRQILDLAYDLGAHSTADFTTTFVQGYVADRLTRVCANTVRGELDYLRAAVNWAVEEEYLDRPPKWKRARPRRSRPRLERVHTIAEVARVLDYLRARAIDWQGHRTYALASLLSMAGPRRDEALHAWVADFDLDQAIWWITDRERLLAGEPGERLKTEKSDGPVPLCPELLLVMAGWLPRTGCKWAFPHRGRTGPWTSGGKGRRPTERLAAAGRACGVDRFIPQVLRHDFATWGRRRWGIGGLGMQDILRHSCPQTQEIYVHKEEELAELVRLVRHVSYR